MKTFKDLQDEVLEWMARENDTGLVLTLVKTSINRIQQKLVTAGMFDFMLWPTTETLSVTADKRLYSLHPLFGQGLFFYNPTINEYMEEVPLRAMMESQRDWQDGSIDEPDAFTLTGVSRVQNQPTAAGVVVATAGGTELATNSVVVTGISGGVVREETLFSVTNWTSITGTVSFDKIISITKVVGGTSWTAHLTLTVGSTTILDLLTSEYGHNFQQLELLGNPTRSSTIHYRFYQKVRDLVRDYDIPHIPEEFSELLVLGTLLKMHGYTRATAAEQKMWQSDYDELQKGLIDTHTHPRTIAGRPKFVTMIPRV